MLTLIVINLDALDVVHNAYPHPDGTPLPNAVKDEIELWLAAVQPPLFAYINEAPLGIIIGMIGLVLDIIRGSISTPILSHLTITWLHGFEGSFGATVDGL